MEKDKQEIILFFKGQIDQIRAVKGSSLARMAVHEAELLLKKYRRDEISLEDLVGNYEKIAFDFTALGLKQMGVTS
jgi:hypothetical protein